jgi:hypothetical protein
MRYTTLGNTKLRVSFAGFGTGGFSRIGLKSGKRRARAFIATSAMRNSNTYSRIPMRYWPIFGAMSLLGRR